MGRAHAPAEEDRDALPRCDYPLWNLKTRTCPECGEAFQPSDFDFVANAVRFCCPECDKAYYGTGLRGHLVPLEFACVGCGAALRMDDMVLRPAAGVEEAQTRTDEMPWLERRPGTLLRPWFATASRSLLGPLRLIRAVPVDSPASRAWWYAALTVAILCTCGYGFTLGGIGLLTIAGGSFDPGPFAISLGFIVVGVVVFLTGAAVWGLVTHGVLHMTGGAPHPIGRTYQAMCYSVAGCAPLAVPCLAFHLTVFGLGWWIVVAVLMVWAAQGVSGVRATVATLVFPAIVGSVLLAGLTGTIVWGMGQARTQIAQQAAMMPENECQRALDALLTTAHGSGWPDHALVLVAEDVLEPELLVASDSMTLAADVAVGETSLEELAALTPARRQEVVEAALASRPPAAGPHRVGDYVFTYHGIDLARAPGDLWLLILAPDPSGPGEPSINGALFVGRADGMVETIPSAGMSFRLEGQNRLRAEQGLPPLPLPSEVLPDE